MKNLKLDLNTILIVTAVVLVLLLLKECNSSADLKAKSARNEQNVRALTGTLAIAKNKANELQAEKSAFIATKEELKLLNAELHAEVQKQKGRVLQLTTANAELKQEIKGLKTQISIDGDIVRLPGVNWPKAYKLSWGYDTTYTPGNYRKIFGFSRLSLMNDSTIRPGLTDITQDITGFRLVTGLIKEGSDYKIFIKSDHPGFSISGIDGAIIPGKNNPLFGTPKKWGIASTFGPNISYGYGPSGRAFYFGFGITFGLSYNIIKF